MQPNMKPDQPNSGLMRPVYVDIVFVDKIYYMY